MKKTVTLDSDFDFEFGLAELIEKLNSIPQKYPECSNFRFDVHYESKYFQLLADREETLVEKKVRLYLEKSRADEEKERELKLFEQLKKKYE